jgi:hypothetical protein
MNNSNEYQKEIWNTSKIIEEIHFDLISAKGEDGLRKYEELLKILKDKEISKEFTKKIAEGIKQETELVGWKTKTSSEKQIGNVIYDILAEIQNKKIADNEDKKNELTERFIDLDRRNL